MAKPSKKTLDSVPTNSAEIQQLLNKVKKLEQGEQLDLSSDEDLSIGVMNLISIEEHLFFTSQKTGKAEYLEVLSEVREMRKALLKKLIKDYEGEVWCTSKHLLAASMRLMEVGTKALGKADMIGAQDFFKKAYQLYSLFWGLNLGMIKTATSNEATADAPVESVIQTKSVQKPAASNTGLFSKLGEIVKKAVDCCRE
jgi:hypothetical protein